MVAKDGFFWNSEEDDSVLGLFLPAWASTCTASLDIRGETLFIYLHLFQLNRTNVVLWWQTLDLTC